MTLCAYRLGYNERMATKKKNNELLTAYLLVGEDSLKRSRTLEKLRGRLEELGDLAFNSDALDGELAEGGDIVTACNTVPFASEKRLVHVRNADKLKKVDGGRRFVFEEPVRDDGASSRSREAREEHASLQGGRRHRLECDHRLRPPSAKELPAHIRALAVGCGVAFTDSAARKLIEFVGEDMIRIDSEVRKIALAHRGSDAVNDVEVASMVAHTSEVKWWYFVDAFSARDLPKCLALLDEMKRTSPHSLLPKCVIRIRELICVQTMACRGNPAAAAKELKLPDWKVKTIACGRVSTLLPELRHALFRARRRTTHEKRRRRRCGVSRVGGGDPAQMTRAFRFCFRMFASAGQVTP